MVKIEDISDPRIEYYKSMKSSITLAGRRLFVAEGEKIVRKLIGTDIEIVSILAVDEFYTKSMAAIKNRSLDEDKLFVADNQMLKNIIGFRLHSGVMAIAVVPAMCRLSELTSPLVTLNSIVDSENVGSIVRNCAAFGINSILFDRPTSSPYIRRAVRVSMGAVFGLKLHKAEDLAETLSRLKAESAYSIISMELTEGSKRLADFDFPGKPAIVFGSEGWGIDPKILAISDAVLLVPIEKGVDSLNVAATSAIVLNKLYETRE